MKYKGITLNPQEQAIRDEMAKLEEANPEILQSCYHEHVDVLKKRLNFTCNERIDVALWRSKGSELAEMLALRRKLDTAGSKSFDKRGRLAPKMDMI